VEVYLEGYRRHGCYQDYYTFQLAAPTLPARGEDSRLEMLIDLELKPGKVVDEKSGRIDFHDLGFSDKLVLVGQEIAILHHATPGVDGQTIYGEPIPAEPGKEVVKLKYDQRSIAAREEREEESRTTVLAAAIDGFLYHEPGRGYFLDPDVLVNQVDFSTGNIAIKDYDQIETSIKVEGSSNILRDSVKPGFTLKAREISVTGNVGRGAVLEGEVIRIAGIVDPEVLIIGQEIVIDKVVGARIKGEQVQINEVVRNARVEGQLVAVKSCLASELTGREVLITEAMHSGTVTAGAFIYCHGIQGSGKSVLRIDPCELPAAKAEVEEINSKLQRLNRKFDQVRPQLSKRKHLLAQLESVVTGLLRQIESNKNITLNEHQEVAIRQLVVNGKIDELGQRLQLTIPSLTRKRLLSYHQFHQEIAEWQQREEELAAEAKKYNLQLAELKLGYTHGLIMLNSHGGGDVHLAFAEHQLPPYRADKPILFSFSRSKKKIIASLTPVSLPAGDRRLQQLSPAAMQVFQPFLAPAAS